MICSKLYRTAIKEEKGHMSLSRFLWKISSSNSRLEIVIVWWCFIISFALLHIIHATLSSISQFWLRIFYQPDNLVKSSTEASRGKSCLVKKIKFLSFEQFWVDMWLIQLSYKNWKKIYSSSLEILSLRGKSCYVSKSSLMWNEFLFSIIIQKSDRANNSNIFWCFFIIYA